jgi:D-xylose transport system substrate-binding protein
MKKFAPGAEVKLYNALGDPATQLAQAKTALTAGASVLVVIPTDTAAAAAIVTEAHNEKVPVISYSRLIKGDVDYFIGKDSVEVGRDQGQWLADNTKDGDNIAILNGSPDDSNAHLFNEGYMSVLQPLFDAKKRTMVGDLWVDKYDPAKAQAAMEQLLTKNHNNIQGVLAANDGIAGGAVAALREVGLDGKVSAITGLDATLAGVQRILQGTQGMSILQPIHEFGAGAAELTAMLLQGQTPPATFFSLTTDNGVAKVPTHAVKIMPITKDNVMAPVDGGLFTKDELCKGIAAGTGPC